MDINIDKEIEKYILSDEVFEQNFNQIFDELSKGVRISNDCTIVVVGGHAGSGKTSLVLKKKQDLIDSAIVIDQDELRNKFPQNLQREIREQYDERSEYLILYPYVNKMVSRIIRESIEKKYNVIFETALSYIEPILNYLHVFKKNGYKAELALLSVHEIEAKFSMLYRYATLLENDGFCRRNTKMKDNSYKIVQRNISQLQELDVFEEIEVYTRGNEKNGMPQKIYSQSSNGKNNLKLALKKGENISKNMLCLTFEERSNYIRNILQKFGEDGKMVELEDFSKKYKTLENECDER